MQSYNLKTVQAKKVTEKFYSIGLRITPAGAAEKIKLLLNSSKRINETFLQYLHEAYMC
jgi:hypothetical protein